ncbi:olfactory receptor 5V1-like [Protobothrops mucrosquamatus]|uniref:olfactory receptor 5V1-like n=1 Tax=Protobothrops mucrosquamatus TaxID=103944 RepID=UPI000775B69D|nr:olfactory receptor 5V1-like [Protobothrops mucrosquamatus]
MENQNVTTEFILLGLSSNPEIQILLFFVFLIIYTITVLGNVLIILIIRTDHHLHTPMFYFLSHLAFVDISYSTVTVPKIMANCIANQKSISLVGCIVQIFSIINFACVDFSLLSVMAYDRYAAICNPLHYSTIMRKQICRQLVGGSWIMGFLDALINTYPLKHLRFCWMPSINHYTCELPVILSLSCSHTFNNYILLIATSIIFGFIPLFLIILSYIYIISSILHIHSAKGRSKAFSTCSSHLIVVCMFLFSVVFRYLKPNFKSPTDLEKVISIQYTILTPMLNPIIYSLKNKEIKVVIRNSLKNIGNISI